MRAASVCAGLLAAAWTLAAGAQADPLATRGGWELGLQAASYEYDEPDFARLDGERLGASAAYTFVGASRLHSRIEARYSYAELDYTGSGTLDGVPDYLVEARVLAGRDYRAGAVVWAPYVGLGLRHLYNDLRGTTSTGAQGYRRKSRYWYVPLGVTLRVALGSGWVMAPQLEYDVFVNGKQRSYLSDASAAFNDVTNEQKNGHGARAQLAFEGPHWAVSLWANAWDIEDSDVQPIGSGFVGLEPANTTREAGVELRYRF